MKKLRIIIVGAGISALSLAWFLKRRHGPAVDLCLLESSSRAGGQISSTVQEGFLFEQGPHSWRSSAQTSALDHLLKDLALQADIITAEKQPRYLYFDNKLHRLPNGVAGWLCSRFGPLLVKALCRDFTAPKGSGADESLADFVNRRLGKELAEQLLDPLVSGIYAGNIQTLSLAATFPRLLQWEQSCGSLLRGMLTAKSSPPAKSAIYSFKRGMGTLIEQLAAKLQPELRLNAPVEEVSFTYTGVSAQLACGKVHHADHLFFAIPAPALQRVMQKSAPHIAADLKQIPSAPIAVVNMGYHRLLLQKQGFGYLIPSREKEKILGVIWDSSIFPTQSVEVANTRLTVMLGGARWHDFHAWHKDDFLQIALEGVKRHMHIDHLPDLCAVKILSEGIPQYHVGHRDCVMRIEQNLQQLSPRLHLLGNSFYGVSVGDCVQQSQALSLKELHA